MAWKGFTLAPVSASIERVCEKMNRYGDRVNFYDSDI